MVVAKGKLQQQLEGIRRLRATGPLSPNYTWWVDQTIDILQTLFEGSWQVRRFQEAVGGLRGIEDSPGLPLWGKWGMRSRLDRAEEALQDILHSL